MQSPSSLNPCAISALWLDRCADHTSGQGVFNPVHLVSSEELLNPTPQKPDPLAQTIKEYLDENWFDNLHLQTYFESLGVSLKTASRRFKNAVGTSPKQYQQQKRLEEAMDLLETTTWRLTDIAYECGFYDSPQFSRLFKRFSGQTPSLYRKTTRAKATQISSPDSQGYSVGSQGSGQHGRDSLHWR